MISYVVATCRKRKDMGYNADHLRREVPGLFEFCDWDMRGSSFGHLGAMRLGFQTGATWVVIFEEDAIPCDGFVEKSERRLKDASRRGFEAVQFFRLLRREIPLPKPGWIEHPGSKWMSAVSNAYHFLFLRKFIIWAEGLGDKLFEFKGRLEVFGGDYMVMQFLKEHRLKFLECVPHLAQHDVKIPSAMKHAGKMFGFERMSPWFRREGV